MRSQLYNIYDSFHHQYPLWVLHIPAFLSLLYIQSPILGFSYGLVVILLVRYHYMELYLYLINEYTYENLSADITLIKQSFRKPETDSIERSGSLSEEQLDTDKIQQLEELCSDVEVDDDHVHLYLG